MSSAAGLQNDQKHGRPVEGLIGHGPRDEGQLEEYGEDHTGNTGSSMGVCYAENSLGGPGGPGGAGNTVCEDS